VVPTFSGPRWKAEDSATAVKMRKEDLARSVQKQQKAQATDHLEVGSRESRASARSDLALVFQGQYRDLLRFCSVRVRNDADAEDILQSAFLAARRAYPDKQADELRPLLFTLVRNMAISHLKLHWNRHRHGGDISEVVRAHACPQSPTPETQLIAVESLVLVEEVLAGMSPRRREALRLHRYEGLTYEEIARRLSVSSAAVKKHVALAVAEIARRLAEAEGRGEDPAG
jgi:RNA polymerase sigma factor (sigma-70 family)